MAMSKPIIYDPSAFDANKDFLIKFSYQGDQARYNRIAIYTNDEAHTLVWEDEAETMQLSHTVPAGTLSNGVRYEATVVVLDVNKNESAVSDKVVFYCWTTPELILTSPLMTGNETIHTSSHTVVFTYSQKEEMEGEVNKDGEPLNWYQVKLYNSLGALIVSSGNRYPYAEQAKRQNGEPLTVFYDIGGLEDNGMYYIRVNGETLNHMVVDTSLVPFSVEYLNPVLFAKLDLTNDACEGYIKIQSNLISLIGHSNPDPPIFIDDMEVDLTGEDYWVCFCEAFSINRDFTMQMLFRKPNDYSVVLEFAEDPTTLELKYMRGKFDGFDHEMAYMKLRVYNDITNYTLSSNYFEIPTENERIHVWMRCINNIYELKAENLGEVDAS